MKPPADRLLDLNGGGADLPAPARPRYGLRWQAVLAVSTLLTIVSSALALQFTGTMDKAWGDWTKIIVLNATYWYTWALFTPAIVWLSQHFRLERQGVGIAVLVHAPAVALFSFGHIAAMAAVRWWMAAAQGLEYSWWARVQRSTLETFDWEMMTYWAIAGLSLAVLYYRESRDRELRSSQLETRLVAARMAALQQQLQPHFLFNTLHAVSSLMHSDVEAADRMLIRLGDLLRMTLEHVGHPDVTLQTELDFVSKYLEIEQTRFADRLIVRFDIDPDALDTLVPSLLLQPLAENAVKHGIARKAGPGHIDITAQRDHDKLRIEIRDDGAGLAENALLALQKGIGVSTTRARLQHQFGADFRFEFHHHEPGVTVVVAVPWRQDHHGRTGTQAGDRAQAGPGPGGGRPFLTERTT